MSAALDNRRIAERLVDALVALGLRDVVLSPGSRHTPLVLAFEQRPELSVHSVLDERAAAFVALGASRARGHAALVCCTSGSAPAHFLPALVEATYSQIPLIALTGDRPRALQNCGAPQTIDQSQLFGRHVRWFFDLAGAETQVQDDWLGAIAARAWVAAHAPERGPVHLNIPFDEPLWTPDTDSSPLPLSAARVPKIFSGPARLAESMLQALAEKLRTAQRGVIVCGPIEPGGLAGIQQEELRAHRMACIQLAERLGWPLIADPLSQLRYGEPASPTLISYGDAISRCPELRHALTPDRVLRLGRTPTSKPLVEWLAEVGHSRTIVIDNGPSWHDSTHSAESIVIADTLALCRDLEATLAVSAAPSSAGWLECWRQAEEAANASVAPAWATELWEGAVARALIEALPAGAVLHVASSMPVRDLDMFGGSLSRELVIFGNRGANGIDGLIATAAGEAWVAGPKRPTALLLGDLAFLHDIGGLAAAAQLPVDLAIVLLDNGGGGIFEFLPIAQHPTAFQRRFLTPQSTRPRALCDAVGAAYLPVANLGELRQVLPVAIGHAGLAVVHVLIDRAANVARHGSVFEQTQRALAACARQLRR